VASSSLVPVGHTYSHFVNVAACCALAFGTTSWLETPPTAHPTKNTAATMIRFVMEMV
jgi:hypothetical protein